MGRPQGTRRVDKSKRVLKAVKVGKRMKEGVWEEILLRVISIDGRLVKQYIKRVVERVGEWYITAQDK